MTNRATAVAEVQGLYGPFSFAEKLLQKIWMRGDFDRHEARLLDGRPLRIVFPGKWNLLGGPDFKGARLVFGTAQEVTTDVELHLHASDWHAHGHRNDPAYNRVGLHVVLFPPEAGHVTLGASGIEIPVLTLLPLLQHDLEEFAADDAVETLSGQSVVAAPEDLAALEPQRLLALLREHALMRWSRKVHYARLRLQRLGWNSACHHAALEVLGYRFNRAPMLRIAARWSLEDWSSTATNPETIFASESGAWSLHGVRPANLPRNRLRQYAAWTRAVPDWPARFASLATTWPGISAGESTPRVRRTYFFPRIRAEIAEFICGKALGGSRLDNLLCDALLPLYAAESGQAPDKSDRSAQFEIWFHWFVGDQSPVLVRILSQLGVCDGRAQPSCHGFAQGLFGWFIERDARR